MEYLAFLSIKEGIYLSELYQAMIDAKEKTAEANCQKLMIEYRGNVKTESIFLITKDASVIAQFRIDEELLLRKNICFENWLDTDKIRKQLSRQNPPGTSTMVQNMRHGMKKVSLEAKVLETPKPTMVQTQGSLCSPPKN